MKLLQEVYTSWCAEVVFITSNFQGNKEIMEGCKIAGIPAFVSHSCSSFRIENLLIRYYIVRELFGIFENKYDSIDSLF
jgi:hypothetical protein